MDNATPVHPTPAISVYGVLILSAGLFTMLIAVGEKMRAGLIAGMITTVIGIGLIIAGKNQARLLQKQEESK
jgi:drug/metabolite transporter (DMT)-like permease